MARPPKHKTKPTIDPILADLLGVPAPPKPEPEPLDELNPFEAAFVANMAKGLTGAKAVMAAGWTGARTSAALVARRTLKKPAVAGAIDALKCELVKNAQYSFDDFIQEMDKAIEFATVTKNATARVRAIELKGKASGHLVDRIDSRNVNAGFQVRIGGIGDTPDG